MIESATTFSVDDSFKRSDFTTPLAYCSGLYTRHTVPDAPQRKHAAPHCSAAKHRSSPTQASTTPAPAFPTDQAPSAPPFSSRADACCVCATDHRAQIQEMSVSWLWGVSTETHTVPVSPATNNTRGWSLGPWSRSIDGAGMRGEGFVACDHNFRGLPSKIREKWQKITHVSSTLQQTASTALLATNRKAVLNLSKPPSAMALHPFFALRRRPLQISPHRARAAELGALARI